MLISIIIPTYNSAKYITKAIDSILKQNYNKYEIIVVDDGSSDNTKKILEPYVRHQGVLYFYKENGGEASARNFGIEKAKGDYIAFLDADDLYLINKLERQLSVFQSNPNVDIVYNDVILIDDENNHVGALKSEEVINNPANFFAQILYRQVIPATASMMIKRKCIENGIRYSEEYTHAVDYSFVIQLAENYNFYYLNESLYYYRRHSGNLTNNHLLQVNCEKDIVKSLGINKIKQIVAKTTYSDTEKTILLGKILLKIEEYESAIQELNKVQFNDWEYYFVKGVLFYRLNDYLKSKENFLHSISIEEKAESYNNIGCCLFQLGEKENANDYFIRASNLRKHYNDPINNMKAVNEKTVVKITERKLRKELTNYSS